MTKNLLFFLTVGLSSLVLSFPNRAIAADSTPVVLSVPIASEPTTIPQDTTTSTPSDEAFRYAPRATEVFLEAKAFSQALKHIFESLPSDFSNRGDALNYLEQTNNKLVTIEDLMNEAAQRHTKEPSVTEQEVQNRAQQRVAGMEARTRLLAELLSITSSAENKTRPQAMDLKTLEFIENLASTVSEMKEGLEEDIHGIPRKHKHPYPAEPSYRAAYFDTATLDATLNKNLKESLLDFNQETPC